MHYMRVDTDVRPNNDLYVVRFLGNITFYRSSGGTDVVFPRMFMGIYTSISAVSGAINIPLFSYSLGDVEMHTGIIQAADDGVRFTLPAASADASITANISMMSFLVRGIESVIEG